MGGCTKGLPHILCGTGRGKGKKRKELRSSISLQKSITERTSYQRASGANGLGGTYGFQARVHLDQVHGHQVARLVHALADEVTLTQGQSSTDGGASAGGPLGVQRIDVKGEVNGSVVANVGQGHLDNTANSVAVEWKGDDALA